jgi:DNA-binding transcriptional regulator WhiA
MPSHDKKTLAYIIGIALGDGNLSNPNGRAIRLRITCDTQYKILIFKICRSIEKLLPNNKVSIYQRKKNYCDISCYSNKWEKWLGWKVGKGSKCEQNVKVPRWIKCSKRYSIECLRGLFESDGSVYKDRGYKMAIFVSSIPNLANDVFAMMKQLKFNPHMYMIMTTKRPRYNIRLSKNVDDFIRLTQIDKR